MLHGMKVLVCQSIAEVLLFSQGLVLLACCHNVCMKREGPRFYLSAHTRPQVRVQRSRGLRSESPPYTISDPLHNFRPRPLTQFPTQQLVKRLNRADGISVCVDSFKTIQLWTAMASARSKISLPANAKMKQTHCLH